MFRIKICGITNVDDAVAAVDAGADAIGLNFYDKSPRCVRQKEWIVIARTIELPRPPSGAIPDATCFGVFVNDSYEFITKMIRQCEALSGVQLHGDESPELLASFGGAQSPLPKTQWQLIRARRMDDRGVSAIAEDLQICRAAGRAPDAVLVDALTPGRYGGTGETVSWVGLADHRRWLGDTPLILAGGLTPDNVAEAIRIVRPAAVDVASGVESAPGKKDPHKVRDFIAAARAAFEASGERGA